MAHNSVDIYEIGNSLPAAIHGGPSDLSKSDQLFIRSISGNDPVTFLLTLSTTWALIAAAVGVGVYFDSWLLNLVVICFIATRQNVLGLLTHEQVHSLGIKGKIGDAVTNLFCAFPILISLEGYRRIHLTHHSKYFTVEDPDYRRKQGKDWTFPQSKFAFFRRLIRDLVGLSLIATVRGKTPGRGATESGARTSITLRVSFYILLGVVLTYTNTWQPFLIYWLAPIVTVLQVIVRWGAVCEHRYNLVDPSVQESTPLIEPRWWERLLLPNLNFNLHVYHHWYPAVPFSKLPVVHDIFSRNGLLDRENVFNGYVDYLRFLTNIDERCEETSSNTHRPVERGLRLVS